MIIHAVNQLASPPRVQHKCDIPFYSDCTKNFPIMRFGYMGYPYNYGPNRMGPRPSFHQPEPPQSTGRRFREAIKDIRRTIGTNENPDTALAQVRRSEIGTKFR